MKLNNYLMLPISLLIMLLSVANAEAQIRVGGSTAPDANAVLDLNPSSSSDASRGLLLPRVRLLRTTDPAPTTTHTYGMYVYNVATQNDVAPGVYYNDGTKWKKVVASGDISISDLDPNFINNIQVDIANHFHSELGDTIISYITNNVTQELTESIMANVNVASADNTLKVTGNGTSDIDLSVNVKNVADSIAQIISNTTLKDSIVNIVKENAMKVKQLEIALNESIGTQSKYYYGTTATTVSPIKIVSIEPQLTGDKLMLGAMLKVNVHATLNAAATEINWNVSIDNDNIDAARTCMLTKVIISYICEEDINNATNGNNYIVGK